MSDLVQTIKEGQVVDTSTTSISKTNKGSELGKDEFLQLLVTQMKYQDPLNPATDTQYVSQLATFSQLEQMQNLNSTTVTTQAYSLVGKEVIISTTSATGEATTKQGRVDYVTLSGGKSYLSIEGTLYSVDDLQTVIGESYIADQKAPKVTATNATFDLATPKDIEVAINMGQDEYAAGSVAVVLNGKAVASDNLTYSNGKLTIKKEALTSLGVGKYTVAFVFDDVYKTTVTDKVTLAVSNSAVAQ